MKEFFFADLQPGGLYYLQPLLVQRANHKACIGCLSISSLLAALKRCNNDCIFFQFGTGKGGLNNCHLNVNTGDCQLFYKA